MDGWLLGAHGDRTYCNSCLSVCLSVPTNHGWMDDGGHGINTQVVQLYWLQLYCNVKCKLCVVVVVTGPGPSPVPVPVRSRSRYDAPVPVCMYR